MTVNHALPRLAFTLNPLQMFLFPPSTYPHLPPTFYDLMPNWKDLLSCHCELGKLNRKRKTDVVNYVGNVTHLALWSEAVELEKVQVDLWWFSGLICFPAHNSNFIFRCVTHIFSWYHRKWMTSCYKSAHLFKYLGASLWPCDLTLARRPLFIFYNTRKPDTKFYLRGILKLNMYTTCTSKCFSLKEMHTCSSISSLMWEST